MKFINNLNFQKYITIDFVNIYLYFCLFHKLTFVENLAYVNFNQQKVVEKLLINSVFNSLTCKFYSRFSKRMVLSFKLIKNYCYHKFFFLVYSLVFGTSSVVSYLFRISFTKDFSRNLKILQFRRNKEKKRGIYFKLLVLSLKYFSDLKLEILVDLVCIDRLGSTFSSYIMFNRFELMYIFRSLYLKSNCMLISSCLFDAGAVGKTISDFFYVSNWLEREIWDMFGLRFSGHNDLRRLLSDYGFRGFPLRKDFPSVGFKQVRYDTIAQSVIYENLFLMQEEREILMVNKWSNLKQIFLKIKMFNCKFSFLFFKLKFFLNLKHESFFYFLNLFFFYF